MCTGASEEFNARLRAGRTFESILSPLPCSFLPCFFFPPHSQWQHYTGGLFDADKYCKNSNEAGNHIVELLGYGRQDGKPYWLVKNSWGNAWGENGFIKLPMGMNACGLFNCQLPMKQRDNAVSARTDESATS